MRNMSDADEDGKSPLTTGLEKRALLEMRAVLSANGMRAFYPLLVAAGCRGIVSTIEYDSANLEDIASSFNDVSADAVKTLKRLAKLLDDSGKQLEPVEAVPGSNAEDRAKNLHRVICLFNKNLSDSRARATELAIRLTANNDESGDEDEPDKAAKKKKKKKKKEKSDSSGESDSSSDSADRRAHRKRTKAQVEQRTEARETRNLHAVYEALNGFSPGTSMMSARVPHAKSRKAFSAALEGAKPSLPKLADVSPAYESTDLPLDVDGAEHGLVVSMMHVKCILDHIALTHAVDLSSKFFAHIKPRPCDRVDLEVTYVRPGKDDKKEVVTNVGVRPDRLDRLEFTLWAAVIEHRISTRALAAVWARIYKRADQLMQQENSTITYALDTLLNEADLFRPVHATGSGSGGGSGHSRSGGGSGRASSEGTICYDFQKGRCNRGASCKFVHPSALKKPGAHAAGEDSRRRSEREPPRSRSASRGRSPSRSPERGGNGRGRDSAATPGGSGRRRDFGKVGFFS